MNQSVPLASLASAVPVANPARKSRFHPRLEILDEVVAGFLWMQLDLPEDITRPELESFAHRLVTVIQAGGDEADIAARITGLQCGQFCRRADFAAIDELARRAIAAVKATHARI
jgi:hypothetical protein